MTDAEKRLAACLSRLLHACTHLDPKTVSRNARREFAAAREQAAKALLLQRAKQGEPWLAPADLDSFWDRWTLVREQSAQEGVQS
jgi:hypothetical protein